MGNKFTAFLIVVSLAIVAFLGGYLLSQKDLTASDTQKGAFLNKFAGSSLSNSNQQAVPNNADFISFGKAGAESPVSSGQNRLVSYFDTNTGKLYKADFESKEEKVLSDTLIPNFVSGIWSPDLKKVIIEVNSPKGSQYRYFDYTSKKFIDLNSSIGSLAFSPSGNEIVYFSKRGEGNSIYLAQSDGSSPKSILTTRIPDLDVYWQNQDNLSFKTKNKNSDFFILSKGGSLVKVLDSKPGLDLKWSPKGDKLVYSVQNNNQPPELFVKNVEKDLEIALGVRTPASKCAWSLDESRLVCAVAKVPGLIGDDLYQINLADYSKKLIISPPTVVSVKDIFLSSLENYIILLDDLKNQLYYFKMGNKSLD